MRSFISNESKSQYFHSLLKDIKNTLSQSAVYGLSRVATKLISFILIPLYTARFTSDAIANINLLESFWQYLFTVCMFAFETAIISFCTSRENQSEKNKILFNFLFLLLLNSTVIILAGIFFSDKISLYILKEASDGNVILYCFFISAFESLLIIPMTVARISSKPLLYTAITVSSLLINLLLQLYFILVLKLGFEYIFLAKMTAPALIFILFLPYLLKNLNFKIDFQEIKKILKFSFPLMLAMLFSLLLNTVDRFILADYVSKQDVAVYTIGYSIGSVANAFILTPFTLAINIIFWKKISDDNFRRFMTKSSTYLFTAMIFASMILTLFLPYVIKLFVRNENLWQSAGIIPYILFANCFVALFTFPSLDIYFIRKTHLILYIIFISLVFNVAANIILIKYFGIYASAAVTVMSGILMIMLGYFFTKDYSFTKFELYKIFLLSAVFLSVVYVSGKITYQNLYLDIFIKLLLIFSSAIILYNLRFFEPVEIERIRGFFNKYLFRFLKR